jgi:hypothetical protein
MMPRLPKSLRKDSPPTLEELAPDQANDHVKVLTDRVSQLERALGILLNDYVGRFQLRYVGADSDIVGASRQFVQ